MNSTQTPKNQEPKASKGFSLIITVTMMVLLALISVGLLSLSSVTLRSANQTSAAEEAEANARLALTMALGELQKLAGPDTRVTARADILDEDNPLVTGVWRSWEGTNHEQDGQLAGRPIAPDYERDKQDRFLSWLISDVDPQSDNIEVPDVSRGGSKVTLVGENTVGAGGDRERLQIHVEPTEIVENQEIKGSYAWWVGGENQKARITRAEELENSTSGDLASQQKSHSTVDPEVFNIRENVDDPNAFEKTVGLGQVDLISDDGTLPAAQEFYHDLSVNSVGLLTNVATGGWKKDLSLFSEDENRQTRGLPLFRLSPDQVSTSEMATTRNFRAENSILYPWSDYRGNSNSLPIYQHGAVASWAHMLDYATSYKRLRLGTSGRAVVQASSEDINGDDYEFLHKVRILPVIARIQWVFSHFAAPSTQPRARPGELQASILMTPVITLWNPYNVEINFTNTPLNFSIPRPLPVAFNYSINGIANPNFNCLFGRNIITNTPALSDATQVLYRVQRGFTLQPGATLVFSPESERAVNMSASPMILSPGFRPLGGHLFPVLNSQGNQLSGTGATTIQPAARFDTVYNDGETGVGVYLDMRVQGGSRNTGTHLAYRMVYSPEVARSVYNEFPSLSSATLTEALVPKPFMTTVFGFRMASNTHLAARGFLQSSPLVNFTAMGDKDLAEVTIRRDYGGTNHPVNSPFDFSFRDLAAVTSVSPNADNRTDRGFIVTGFSSADGLSRCVVAELPTRPLQSLGELQHWDLRYENPIPPFAFNLIGNSDASPLLPPDAVVNRADADLTVNLQHDDSYCANHLLFDDWFLSSIAPDPDDFGTRGRSQEDVYVQHLRGEQPLPNQAYQAIAEDVASVRSNPTNSSTLFQEEVSESDSWQTIASRLEVRGMFNVNSTSLNAWRALLRHSRNQEIPFINDSGNSWEVSRSEPTDYVFSRFSVAGDMEASERGTSGSFLGANEFSGYRQFDEETIDLLAEEIVNQVRLRGPFLSLAEFVNRQLSSGELALGGAIQTALNNLGNSSSNPFAGLEGIGTDETFAVPPGGANSEYQFPDAAAGRNTYGLPGWTRQADVLRPIAPILTARDDTFTIRAYGDSRDRSGRIVATATCEAVVQRTRDFVDSADEADITDRPVSEVNQNFGRRIKVISFRWLAPSEV